MKNDHLTQAAAEGRTVKLPELPQMDVHGIYSHDDSSWIAGYSEAAARGIQLAAYRAGMARAAEIAEGMDCAHRCAVGGEVAAAIKEAAE
jgi:hypothetical protein